MISVFPSILLFLSLFRTAFTWSRMATTTHYHDNLDGACGCGADSGGTYSWVEPNGIEYGVYTAAGSQALFDYDGSEWCGSGCGMCFQLTSTGTAPDDQGAGGGEGETVTMMLVDLCPYDRNEDWCPQPGSSNPYGYYHHFDIYGGVPGWDNEGYHLFSCRN